MALGVAGGLDKKRVNLKNVTLAEMKSQFNHAIWNIQQG